jgi:hypothetical protein
MNTALRPLRPILTSRLNQYVVLAGAAAAVAPQAEAAVVYSGVVNIPIPASIAGMYLDITSGNTGGGAFAGWDINPYYGGTAMYTSANGGGSNAMVSVVAIGAEVNNSVAPGTMIPGTLVMESSVARAVNGPAGVAGIMGVQFVDSGNTFNGWVRFIPGAAGPGTLVDYAWDNTPNAPIAAGDTGVIPEPGPLSLLALGAAGLGRWRRRKSA